MGVFERIKTLSPLDSEEIRYDLAVTKPTYYDYVGFAESGSSTASNVWSIVKITYDGSGNTSREVLFTGVAWDNRASL